MDGVYFKAWNGGHYVSLAEILRAVGDRARYLKWTWRIDEAAPAAGGSDLDILSPGRRVSTAELLCALPANLQIIDGEIDGSHDGGRPGRPSLRLRAVDSTWWDVESDAPEILAAIVKAFPDAAALPKEQDGDEKCHTRGKKGSMGKGERPEKTT